MTLPATARLDSLSFFNALSDFAFDQIAMEPPFAASRPEAAKRIAFVETNHSESSRPLETGGLFVSESINSARKLDHHDTARQINSLTCLFPAARRKDPGAKRHVKIDARLSSTHANLDGV